MKRSVIGLLALALPATALADVSPASVEYELGPGESVTLDKTVTLPSATPKLDMLMLVDLSGSYYDDLANIKSLAPDLFDDIRFDVPDSEFGLATFVDFPFSPWGSTYSGDYAYQLDQDLTDDRATWLTAINAMSTSSGADYPESQLEGIYQAVTGNGREMPTTTDGDYDDLGEIEPGWNASFRPDATKVIVITTDAAFHEGGDYGYSFDYPGATMAETIDALVDNNIKVIALSAGTSTLSQMDELAVATGGASLTTTRTSSDIADAILDGLEAITYNVTANPGAECDPLMFGYVPGSFDDVLNGETVVFEETITVPSDITDADLDADGEITCEVEFRADDTVVGIQSVNVYVPLNAPPVAVCEDIFLSADDTCSADGDIDGGSYDPDGDPLVYDYDIVGPYPVGTTEVVLTVTDPSGESSSCIGTVTVEDDTPAEVIVDGGDQLWPPNHKYVDFTLADCGVTVYDACGGDLDVDSVGYIDSIYSDEPENATGNGDGNTWDDIVITGDTTFSLRAERAGGENGRVYGVTFDVDDGAGNITTATCDISVPHSKGKGGEAIDDGPGAGYTVY